MDPQRRGHACVRAASGHAGDAPTPGLHRGRRARPSHHRVRYAELAPGRRCAEPATGARLSCCSADPTPGCRASAGAPPPSPRRAGVVRSAAALPRDARSIAVLPGSAHSATALPAPPNSSGSSR
ncbi:hypothetical protein E2562_033300 [Oryza meyeriana var. granulata]|uniref:Uncharacterized protein n=1 Tax=Oryza meyeriana var. granulata TaxID=110450 RepID=A0A6G1F0Y1_9ORYZ|nr:hypothetical protein E2562_033300 [Oryza meyeriana var. granulata]